MPFVLVFVGMLLIVTGARDTYSQLGTMVAADVTGSNGGKGFAWWIAGIGGVGALGAIPELRTFSHYMLALILIALLLNNRGVFAQFTKALGSLPNTAAPTQGPGATNASAGTASAIPSASQPGSFWNQIFSKVLPAWATPP